ncbi:MAG: hypothetical protein M1352_01640 [Patescibacteria group bacterium]|nr:hypothetical protein [Patescibacteria group bacterium]
MTKRIGGSCQRLVPSDVLSRRKVGMRSLDGTPSAFATRHGNCLMSTKTFVFLGMILGSIVGGYLPAFFGVGIFSFSSIILSGLGALAGIYLAYRISKDW